MLSEQNPHAQLPGEVRLLSAREVCRVLGCSKSTLLRLIGDPRRSFPAPLRLDPYSQRSGLRFDLFSVRKWIAEQQQLTVDLKGEATPLQIHLARAVGA
jgi:predicted DNA-binding transcriptional regulator AlpA